MAIRVAHVGTGNVGRLALTELVTNPQFELTGLCVSSPEKVGKDAGTLAGVDVSTGIAAVDDLDAVLATGPECVVYCAMGDTRLPERDEGRHAHPRRGHQRRRVVAGDVAVSVGRHARQVHRPRRRCCTAR